MSEQRHPIPPLISEPTFLWKILHNPIPKRYLVTPILLLFGFCIGWFSALHETSEQKRKTLALHRTLFTDGSSSNPIPAVAFVILRATTNGYVVNVEIEMEHPGGTGYRQTRIGEVSSIKEAMSKWGFVEWRDDGLHVGKGSNEFFVPHSELEGGR